jgi:hypothetical protein
MGEAVVFWETAHAGMAAFKATTAVLNEPALNGIIWET